MFVIAAPGQGAQKPGFLSPWLELPGIEDQLEKWSSQTGLDLRKHGTKSNAETLRNTEIAQPLIVAVGLLIGKQLTERLPKSANISLAGHSVGEFTAAALSGLISPEDAMAIVMERGKAMAIASAEVATGMAAVLGIEWEELKQVLEGTDLVAANFNGAGQVVVGGRVESIENLKLTSPAGCRVISLDVAGAFHTAYMGSAETAVRKIAISVETQAPQHPLYSNRDGEPVSRETAVGFLVAQITRPVRWDLCMQSFAKNRAKGFIELPPAGTLTGLAKRSLKGVPSMSINNPEDLDSISSFMGNA